MQALLEKINERFGSEIDQAFLAADQMPTIEIPVANFISVARALYAEKEFDFKQLIDVCGVDYLDYGDSEWRTEETTLSGFSRGKDEKYMEKNRHFDRPRFASVYHLLSLTHNHRLRMRVFIPDENPKLPSVFAIWNAANWFEREAFDLYGIIYEGHPDLRRLLTDYGFIGHPFRKDFPLIGEVEMRYDAQQKRCIYEPVSIQPRVTVPKVVRSDCRYSDDHAEEKKES